MHVRRRLLLIAPRFSYRIAAYVEAARALNVDLRIASDGSNSLVTELAQGLHIDLDDNETTLRRISRQHHKTPFHAVIAADDRTVAIAAQVATALGLPCNPILTAQISRRKDLSRQALAAAGIAVPTHQILDIHSDPRQQQISTGFPCVIKPLSLSASTGVIRANNINELASACVQLQPIIAHLPDEENRLALLERYIDGIEVAVEGLVSGGRFELLAIIDKPEPLTGPYFEESYYTTPSRLDKQIQQDIVATVRHACHALGIVTGPVHAELRIDEQTCWILEVATRSIGGDCSKMLQFIYGCSLEQMVIANALQLPLRAPGPAPENPDYAAGVMMIPTPKDGILRRVEGLLQAQAVEFIEAVEIAIQPGHELIMLPRGSSYLGFMFARAPTPQQVEQALRHAHACLNIVVAPLFKIAGMP